MQFNVGKTSVNVSFSFLALVLLLFINGNNKLYLITVVSAIIHECVHILFILIFSGEVSSISLSIVGADIKRASVLVKSSFHEAIIAICAPLFNLLIFIIFYNSTLICKDISNVNLTLGLINILPFHSFDGGCFLKHLLYSRFNKESTDKIIFVTSIIVTFLGCFTCIYLCYINKIIHTSIILCLYMILSLVLKK